MAVGASGSALAQPTFTVVSAGGADAQARAVSPYDGRVVTDVLFADGSSCVSHQDVMSSSGQVFVGCTAGLPPWRTARAVQLNSDWQTLVNYRRQDNGLGMAIVTYNFSLGIPTLVEDLGLPPPGYSFFIESGDGLSNYPNRRAAVTLFQSSPAAVLAFVWNSGGHYQSLGPLPPGWSGTVAAGISDDGGWVIGSAYVDGAFRPFRWTDAGRFHDCGNLPPGWNAAYGTASRDGSTIVGYAETTSGVRAMFWEPAARYHDDGRFGGYDCRYAAASYDGGVRGGYAQVPSGSRLAIIATPEYGLRSLSQLLGSWRIAEAADLDIAEIKSISADGLTVVGYGLKHFPAESTHGFVLHMDNWCRPGLLAGPENVFVCPFEVAQMSVVIDGPRSPAVRWAVADPGTPGSWIDLIDGPIELPGFSGSVSGTDTQTLSFASLAPTSTADFRCTVSNDCGTTVSAAATITVCCPCAADFDLSGGAPDVNDVDAFFTAWIEGDPTADADCSGGTPDVGDIDAFFVQWLNGGC